MTQDGYDYVSLLSLRSANGAGGHSLPWINMAVLCDCFKLNASKYLPFAIYCEGCKSEMLPTINKCALMKDYEIENND